MFAIISTCAFIAAVVIILASFGAWQRGKERRREAYAACLKSAGWAAVNYHCLHCGTWTKQSPAASVECSYCEGEVLIDVPKDWRAPRDGL